MLKFYRILLLTLVAVFLASTAGIARYAADSCTQARMYRQLAVQTENFLGDAASTGNNFLPQYQALYTQNRDRKSTRLNSSHTLASRMPSSA